MSRFERNLRQAHSNRAGVEDINEKKRRLFRSLRTKFIAAQIKILQTKKTVLRTVFVYHNT
jgi:hypothetical protein